jgi:hypothetical protein
MEFGLDAAEGLDPEGIVGRIQEQIDALINEYSQFYDISEVMLKKSKEKDDDALKEAERMAKKRIEIEDELFQEMQRMTLSERDFAEQETIRKFDAMSEQAANAGASAQTLIDIEAAKYLELNQLTDKWASEDAAIQRKRNEESVRLAQQLQDEIDQQRQEERDREIDHIMFQAEIRRTGLDLIGNISNLFFKQQENQSRKQFEFQKKFNIATALIDTYISAQSAYKSQMLIPDPSSPIRAAVAAAAAISAGLARVNQIRNQQFNATSAVSANTTSPTMASGQTDNRLPETGFTLLRGPDQSEQDFRVYVLEKDITNGQANNNNIRRRARVR